MPGELPLIPGEQGEAWLGKQTIGIECSTIMVAAGAIMGLRVGVSLLVGAIFFYGIVAPELIAQGWAQPGYRGIVSWTLWPATSLMLAAGLLSFALRWRTVIRAFRGLASIVGRPANSSDPLARIEVPGSWFVFGVLVSGTACVVLGHLYFQVTWWVGILSVLLTFVLSIVAARATGETSVTPIGAMGKITQLMLGVLAPGNATANLMGASTTAGAAAHSADLLTDLKSGYLLGGNPRKQTISQLFGVLAGTLVCVPVYQIVVDPKKLGSPELPAPSAKVWEAVARLFVDGFGKLAEQHVTGAVIIGAVLGVVLTLLEEFLPAKHRKWIPSPIGLGIAGVVPAFNSMSMFAALDRLDDRQGQP